VSGIAPRSDRWYWLAIGIYRDACDPGCFDVQWHDRACRWARGLASLAACLRDAGALCAAFELGNKATRDLYWHGRAWWEPGCGRPAETP